MNSELQTKLEKLALQKSEPFCYSCYKACPKGKCSRCGSDDLMRLTKSGCEYGTYWIIRDLLSEELSPMNIDEAFEECVCSGLEEEQVKIGWMTFDAVTVMKELDPISWEMAKSEYENNEESEGNIISFDSGISYYSVHDVENFIEENLLIE